MSKDPRSSPFSVISAGLLAPVGPSGDSDDKESACNAEDPGSIPGLGRAPGEGHGNPLQCSCLVNSMDRGAWWAMVHGVTKNQTQLSMHGFLSPDGLSCERVSRRQCVITGAALVPLLQTLSVCMPPRWSVQQQGVMGDMEENLEYSEPPLQKAMQSNS